MLMDFRIMGIKGDIAVGGLFGAKAWLIRRSVPRYQATHGLSNAPTHAGSKGGGIGSGEILCWQ